MNVIGNSGGRSLLVTYIVAGTIVLFSLFSIGSLSYYSFKDKWVMEGPSRPGSQDMFAFLQHNTGEREVMGFWKPRAMLLFSGRNGIVPKDVTECVSRKASYYVYYNGAYADQISYDTLITRHDVFRSIYKNSEFEVFKIFPADGNTDPSIHHITHSYFPVEVRHGADSLIGVWSNQVIKSKTIYLKKGNYILRIVSRGTAANGEWARVEVNINSEALPPFFTGEAMSKKEFPFYIKDDTTITIGIRLVNDYSGNGEDRNALVSYLDIYEAGSPGD